ncbi:hypothetical protein C8T65DRAFT_126517 [Cerioporus squamosus]|nr:hypothetical protein C8T65DRAFT_126517 [Cerioporus squamosus]
MEFSIVELFSQTASPQQRAHSALVIRRSLSLQADPYKYCRDESSRNRGLRCCTSQPPSNPEDATKQALLAVVHVWLAFLFAVTVLSEYKRMILSSRGRRPSNTDGHCACRARFTTAFRTSIVANRHRQS